MFSLEGVRCVGACGLAPVVIIDDHTHGAATYEKIRDELDGFRGEEA
jgi:NADH:ubiquinone oxidoreductase subunit E